MKDFDVKCGLAGWGVARIAWGDIPRLRKSPGLAPGLTPAVHLKLADEQTVVACVAVLSACERSGWAPTDFADWGVVAAPTCIGRTRLAPAFRRFPKMGARGVSPLIIPTMSNHAIAGTLGLILGCHGPTFGVGGSTTQVDDLFLNALNFFDQDCPGIWAVMTAWDPEPIPDDAGQATAPVIGVGVALALVRETAGGAIHLTAGQQSTAQGTVFELADFLEQAGDAASWHCPILGGGQIELSVNSAASAQPLRRAG